MSEFHCCKVLELRLFERLSVSALAAEIGYSARILERACESVSGQTAKQVVDERISLELRRLLADSQRPMSAVREQCWFDNSSNFTKFAHVTADPRAISVRRKTADRLGPFFVGGE